MDPLTPARCLELADEAQAQATGALAQASDLGNKLATGTFLGPNPQAAAAGVGALTQVAGMKFIEGQFWLRRREAAMDEEDDQLDAESNELLDAFDKATDPNKPIIRLSVELDKDGGWDGLFLRIGSFLSSGWTPDEIRVMFRDAGLLLQAWKLPPIAQIEDDDGA